MCNRNTIPKCLRVIVCFLISGFGTSWAQNIERAGKTNADKPFVINMSVRGEYDDNVNTAPDGREDAAFFLNLRPSVTFNFPLDNTLIEGGYTFGFKQYFDREGDSNDDFSHAFVAHVNHRVNSRFTLDAQERFSFDQEDSLSQGGVQRPLGGDRIRNTFEARGTYDWTERFNTATSYTNSYLNYFDKPASDINNYLSHEISQQFRFQAYRTTTPFLNYVFKTVDYDKIDRDRDEHLALAGVDHYLLDNWLISAQAGAQFTLYDNNQFDDTIGPYGSLRTVWNYYKKSNFSAGYTYGTTNTDNGNFASSQAHTFDGTLTHYLTEKFSVGARGRYELSSFNTSQGFSTAGSDVTEHTFSTGINVRYQFTDYLSADAGYTYSQVISDINNREYDRNRVYLGISGAY